MPALAFFDMDGTLVAGDCGVLFVLDCVRRRLLSVREVAAMLAWAARCAVRGVGLPEVIAAKKLLIRVRMRLGEARADALYDEFFQRAIVPRLRRAAVAELRQAAAEGQVVLVTANLRELVLRLGRELGVPEGCCLGAESERRGGQLTGEVQGEIPMGEVRARLLAEWAQRLGVPLERVRAFGDSIHDLPMLRAAGLPCAVAPARALARIAEREGFRVLAADAG